MLLLIKISTYFVPETNPCFSVIFLTFLNKVHSEVLDSNENPSTFDLESAILEQPSTEAYFFEVLTEKTFP